MPTAPIINAIPFLKISSEQEYNHDLRCHRNYLPTRDTFLEDIENEVYLETDEQYQKHHDDVWSQYERVTKENDTEPEEHQWDQHREDRRENTSSTTNCQKRNNEI